MIPFYNHEREAQLRAEAAKLSTQVIRPMAKGRNPAVGLDCVGLACWLLDRCGWPHGWVDLPEYRIRRLQVDRTEPIQSYLDASPWFACVDVPHVGDVAILANRAGNGVHLATVLDAAKAVTIELSGLTSLNLVKTKTLACYRPMENA